MASRFCPYCRQVIPAAEFARHRATVHLHRRTSKRLKRMVLARDRHRCTVCGATAPLEIHHLNEDPTDDRPENLETRCRAHNPRGDTFWYARVHA